MNKYAEKLKQERRIERLNQKEGAAYEKAVHEGVEYIEKEYAWYFPKVEGSENG